MSFVLSKQYGSTYRKIPYVMWMWHNSFFGIVNIAMLSTSTEERQGC